MCFSAGASFGAGALLAGIGITSIIKAKPLSHKMFGAIPLIFSIQQFTEGILWLSLTDEKFSAYKVSSMYFFLIFAQVVWPVWVPYSIYLIEYNSFRKKILLLLLGGGILLSAELGFLLSIYSVDAKIVGNHVMYWIDSPISLSLITSVFYFFSAVVPPFFHRLKSLVAKCGLDGFLPYNKNFIW